MDHLNIDNVAKIEKEKERKRAEKLEVEDLLGVSDDIKFLIDNIHYQNADIKRDIWFISSEDLETLPDKIAKIVDEKVDNRQ